MATAAMRPFVFLCGGTVEKGAETQLHNTRIGHMSLCIQLPGFSKSAAVPITGSNPSRIVRCGVCCGMKPVELVARRGVGGGGGEGGGAAWEIAQ